MTISPEAEQTIREYLAEKLHVASDQLVLRDIHGDGERYWCWVTTGTPIPTITPSPPYRDPYAPVQG